MTDLLQDLPPLMLRSEVAKLFRMSERNVRRLEDQGRLRSLKLTPGRPGRVLFKRDDVLQFLAEAEQASN
ncbi:MAG: helix-turn-helix domain-containing protein [Myxococcales bacterium]|nr:helix-turn-helix domain-containing protein [Myxococcales bacterium]